MSKKVVRGPIHEFLDDPEGCGFDPDDDVVLILASEYEQLKQKLLNIADLCANGESVQDIIEGVECLAKNDYAD